MVGWGNRYETPQTETIMMNPAPDWSAIPDGFYAVPDPDEPADLTAWRMQSRPNGGHSFGPTPKGNRLGPMARLTQDQLPADRDARAAFLADLGRQQSDYISRAAAAILADLDGAQRRYAAAVLRCYRCNHKLRDAVSKELGIGPECRKGQAA